MCELLTILPKLGQTINNTYCCVLKSYLCLNQSLRQPYPSPRPSERSIPTSPTPLSTPARLSRVSGSVSIWS